MAEVKIIDESHKISDKRWNGKLRREVWVDRDEGSGLRVRFVHGATVGTFHRPHPAKEAKQYQVEDARKFLTAIGVVP